MAQSGDWLASDPLCSYVSSVSTLVAAHIEEDKLSAVAQTINSLPSVSHNYLREHYYNLWFTLKDSDFGGIDKTIKELSRKFKTDFFSFPAVKRYKLDTSAIKRHNPPDIFNALFCCKVNGTILQSAVRFLCDLPQVSHCLQRRTLPHWPYNLYAMLHEQDFERLRGATDDFVKKFDIEQSQILPTVKSLK